ncbi:hypothetical protein AB0D67_30965 [Streptosporangium sp. NPDC048047]|uniref:hypothetical protein n=1 Tax=Streptosporangium sp. NPDC048047 TaxID=3155748 RepID=UPI003413CDEF
MRSARPTLRCLRDDLDLPLPPVTVPLDETDHPIVVKAAEQFTDADAKHDRIRAIDDQVLFKVKVRRWRGAVWIDADLPRVVAAGKREDGSGGDFYAVLEAEGKAARAQHNATHAEALRTTTFTAHLLPKREDHIGIRQKRVSALSVVCVWSCST